MTIFTQEELEMLKERIDDPDWDISQRNDVYELLPKVVKANALLDGFEKALDEILEAYPIDVFPETTQAERDAICNDGFIGRTSAMMGRHLVTVIHRRAAYFASDEE
jgi:hypothetical protein